jgi:RNA polymerase sigma-70 factor (ECF subfamily)
MQYERRAGVDARFEELFRLYEKPIFHYVYRMVHDRELAEELTQQAFVKAYGALPGLPDEANHRAWLYRIATNACYDHFRRSRLIQWLPLLDQDSPSAAVAAEGASGNGDAVQHTLDRLSPEDRAVLVLYSVEEYSTAEIGQMLNITSGAVKARLFRARNRFRRLYDRED